MKLGILKAWGDDYKQYINACEYLKVNYVVIDILSDDWIQKIKMSKCDGFLARPPCDIQERKSIYDEKLYFINHFMKKEIYPSFDELYIYENKRNMSYFLELFNYPHPKTRVFSRKRDALNFIEKTSYPIVFKTNIGAGASGVTIIKNKKEALKFINKVFGRFNNILTIGKIYWKKYKGIPIPKIGTAQRHYLIVQDYHDIKWEWRIIKIGNNYAGHQKLLDGQFASGSNLVGWVEPPKELLELVRNITERHNFRSVAIDIFETKDGEFLINEIQSIFGSYLPYQMKVKGKKGIYKYHNGEFVFYEGEFHQDASNRLRVEDFVNILKSKQKNT